MKSLQLRGRRQIAEPRKYCLVRVIIFLWHVFFSILFIIGLGIFVLIPFNWYQSLGLGLSGTNGKGSRKSIWNRKFDGIDFGFWRMQIEDYLYVKKLHLPLLGEKLATMKDEE